MRLTQIKAKGFRSYSREVTISDLKAVNFFVGKNNAGKTNVLEMIRLISNMLQTNRPYRNPVDIVSKGTTSCSIDFLFSVSDGERTELIEELARGSGKQSKDFFPTHYLRTVHYYVEFSARLGIEKEFLWISNVANGEVLILSSQRQSNQTLEHKGTNLYAQLQVGKGIENIPEKLTSLGGVVESGQVWSFMDRFDPSDLVTPRVRALFSTVDWSPPNRHASHQLGVSEARKVDTSGNNIPQVWNTMVSDEPEQLVRIGDQMKKIVDIASIRAPVSGNQAIASVRESSGLAFDLSNTSEGVMQTSILVTKIATDAPDTILLIEEPELHLHAAAQRELGKLIDKHSTEKQFFITTHSTLFAGISENSNTYLVVKKGSESSIRKLEEPKDLLLVKSELGHSNIDLFGYNVVVFVEGESEAVAFPILARSMGIDLVKEGVKIVNLKGKGKIGKLEEYLQFLKDSDVVPFVVLDGHEGVADKIKDWVGRGILSEGNSRVWPKEFEDLFTLEDIAKASAELGYSEITKENLEKSIGTGSVVQAIKKLLHDNSQNDLDKPALAESLAIRLGAEKEKIPKEIKELLGTLVSESKVVQEK